MAVLVQIRRYKRIYNGKDRQKSLYLAKNVFCAKPFSFFLLFEIVFDTKFSTFVIYLFFMKKIILSSFLLSLSVFAAAQITITKDDMPIPGILPMFSLPDSVTLEQATVTQTGANQTWDYSFFQPEFQRVDTFISLLDAGITYALSFSSATVARVIPVSNQGGGGGGGMNISISSGFDFFKNTNGNFQKLGSGGIVSISPFPLSLVNNPVDVVYNFPVSFGDKDTSNSEAILNVPNLVYVRQRQTRINHVDGWGSLTTPFKTFDALRVKTRLTGEDSISYNGFNFIQPRAPRTEYKWLANGEKVPVLTINAAAPPFGGIEQITNANYRDTTQNVPYVGIEEMQNLDAKMYPNPSSNFVTIEWETILGKNAILSIYDYNGKKVHEQQINGNQQLILNTQSLSAGTYIVKIAGEKQQFTGTLSVTR